MDNQQQPTVDNRGGIVVVTFPKIEPGPNREDQIEHRLKCLITFMNTPPWRFEEVEDETPGYYSGEVYGGENAEYCICHTEFADTAVFIANAPDDIRWLLDELATARGKAERAEEFIRSLGTSAYREFLIREESR